MNVEFCRELIKAGALADLYNPNMERAPIHEAVISGSTAHVKLLLDTDPLNRVNMVNVYISNGVKVKFSYIYITQ